MDDDSFITIAWRRFVGCDTESKRADYVPTVGSRGLRAPLLQRANSGAVRKYSRRVKSIVSLGATEGR